MAVVTYTNLKSKLKEDRTIEKVKIEENIEVEVKQYLPIEDKIKIITNVLESAADDNNFSNPMKVEVFFNLELLYAYTNISFTAKQKEEPTKIYDKFESSGAFNKIFSAIPQVEYDLLFKWTQETIDNYYKQRNSALGIMEQIATDYKELDFDATQIQNKIADPDNITLLKGIMDNLG